MTTPHQDDLPLASVLPHTVFPGRQTLRIKEVATALGISENQVIALIEEGKLLAIDISDGKGRDQKPAGSRVLRRNWRIPVSAYDAFLRRNNSLANSGTPVPTK